MAKLELTTISPSESEEVEINQPILPLLNLADPRTGQIAYVSRVIATAAAAITTTGSMLFLFSHSAIFPNSSFDVPSLLALTIVPGALAATAVAAGLTETAAKKTREKNEKDARMFPQNPSIVPQNLYLINKNIFSELSEAYLASEEMLQSIDSKAGSDQLVAVLNDVFCNTEKSSALIVNEDNFSRTSKELQKMTKRCFQRQGFSDINRDFKNARHYPTIPQIALVTCCYRALVKDENLLPNVDRVEFGRKYEDLLKLFEEDIAKKIGNAEPVQDLLKHSRNYVAHRDSQPTNNGGVDVSVPHASQLRNRSIERDGHGTGV